MPRCCPALLTTVLILALSACGGGTGGGTTKTVTVITSASGTPTATVTATATGAAPQSPVSPTTSPVPSTSSTAAPTPAVVVHLSTFRSPSGNIGCALFEGSARCDIMHRSWSPPPRPASCQLDYGQGLEVYGSRPGHLVCAGDTALDPSAPILHYGAASVVGQDTCVSATTGMTCTDTRTGHGFWIAIQGYRVF